jgi:hypothetical protein
MRFFRWPWRRRARLHAIGEAEAYARSYGDRSDDIVSVEPVPAPEAEPVQATRGRISDAMLRRAFAARLASRSGRHG